MKFSNLDISCMTLHRLFSSNVTFYIIRISIGEILNVVGFFTICATNRDNYRQNGVNFGLFMSIIMYIFIFHLISSFTGKISPYKSRKYFVMYKIADLMYDVLLLIYNYFLSGLTTSIPSVTITIILCIDMFLDCANILVICVLYNANKRSLQNISR